MIVEARQVTVYFHTLPGKAKRRRAFDRATAYRHAAWTKIRSRCECESPEVDGRGEVTHPGSTCRLHDRERCVESHIGWGGYPSDPEFRAPRTWGVPGTVGTYAQAVAFRLARFYRYLDGRPASSQREDGGGR